jgi:hypothetical protein
MDTKKLGMFIHMHFSGDLKFIHINQRLKKSLREATYLMA